LLDLELEIIAILILIAWNIIVFAMYGIDKRRARLKKRRISEKTLLLSAFLMGGTGALLGMRVSRHKTRHGEFKIGVPLLLLANVAVNVLFVRFIYSLE